MALVKKLQSGSTIDPNSFNDALNTELGQYNLKSKDERKVREALVKLRDTKNISFSTDPVAQKYTVTGPGNEQFAGSPEEIRANWLTGKLKIENDQDAMSVAAAIFGNATNNLKNTTNTASTTNLGTKQNVSLGNFNNYINEDAYGTTEAFKRDFGSIQSDDLRKKKLTEHFNNFLTSYLSGAETNKEKFNYTDLADVQALKNAVNSGDWNTLKTAAYKFHIDPESFLIQPEEQKGFDAKVAETKALDQKKEGQTTLAELIGKGLNQEVATNLVTAGFTKVVNQVTAPGINPEIGQAIADYVRTKGGFVLDNGAGKQIAIDATGKAIDANGSEFDQFNPLYGHAWANSNTGIQFGKGSYKLDPMPAGIGRGLKANIPGYEGWNVTGWTAKTLGENPAVDILGNQDFGKYLTLSKDGRTLSASRNEEGIYTLPDGTTLPAFKPTGYGTVNTYTGVSSQKPLEDFAGLHMYEPNQGYDWHFSENLISKNLANPEGVGTDALQPIADHAAYLKYVYAHPTKYGLTSEQLKSLHTLLVNTHNMLATSGKKYLKSSKQGGVLKFQQGGVSAASDAYMKKYGLGKYATSTGTGTPGTPGNWAGQNVSNLVRGSSGLDQVILGANVATLLPGFAGAGAGIASTGLELYRDIYDPNKTKWDVAGNAALNVGLTAASFVGLGFLRGAKALKVVTEGAKLGTKVGADIVKALDKTGDIAKVGREIGANITPIKGAVEGLASFTKLNPTAKTLGELTKIAKETNNVEAAGHLATITGFAENLAKSKNLLQIPTLRTTAQVIGKTAQKAGTVLALGNAAMNMGTALDGVKKIASGNLHDLSLDEANAITSVLFAGKIAGTHAKMKIGKKYGLEASEQTPAYLKTTIKGKEITIDTPEIVAKNKTNIKFLNRNKEVKEAFVQEHNNSIDKQIANTKDPIELEKLNKSKITIDDLKTNQIVKVAENKSGFLTKDVPNIGEGSQNYQMQQLGIRWANRYGLASNSGRVATSPWGKAKEVLIGTKEKPLPIEEVTPIISEVPNSIRKNGNYENKNAPFSKDKVNQLLDLNKSSVKVSTKKSVQGKDLVANLENLKKLNAKNPSFIKEQGIKNRQAQIDIYRKQLKSIIGMKKGGIIKFATPAGPLALGRLDPKKGMSIIAKDKSRLNYNPLDNPYVKSQGIFDASGQYTPDFINRRNAITPEWFAANKDEINNRIKMSGSKYVVSSPEQLKAGVSDHKPGILHDIVMGLSPIMPAPPKGMPAISTNPAFAPANGNNTGIGVKAGADIAVSGAGTKGDLNIKQTSGAASTLWDWGKKYLNPADIANTAMFMDTMRTNKIMGDEQRQAINAELYTLPSMPDTYVRIGSQIPYAEKRSAEIQSQAKRIGESSSDIDKSNAIRLQGIKQSSDMMAQAQQGDVARIDKLRGVQIQSDAQVKQYNLGVLGKNRALTADAFQKTHLINSNQELAQQTARKNYILAADKNRKVNAYEAGLNDFYGMSNDPHLKQLGDSYTNLVSEENEKKLRAKYDVDKAIALKNNQLTFPQTFEESSYNTSWQNQISKLQKEIDVASEPLKNKQRWLQLKREMMYVKKGGSISKQEKSELLPEKANYDRQLKDTERVFNSILHNNEMLQKALIKVFK